MLIELPLAATLDDAHLIIAAQQAAARRAVVDMFSRFRPANRHLRQAVADQRYGPLTVTRTPSPGAPAPRGPLTWAWPSVLEPEVPIGGIECLRRRQLAKAERV
jgi:predicted dehydrogenase